VEEPSGRDTASAASLNRSLLVSGAAWRELLHGDDANVLGRGRPGHLTVTTAPAGAPSCRQRALAVAPGGEAGSLARAQSPAAESFTSGHSITPRRDPVRLRVYGRSEILAQVGDALEQRGAARHGALAPGVQPGCALWTADIDGEAADTVLATSPSKGWRRRTSHCRGSRTSPRLLHSLGSLVDLGRRSWASQPERTAGRALPGVHDRRRRDCRLRRDLCELHADRGRHGRQPRHPAGHRGLRRARRAPLAPGDARPTDLGRRTARRDVHRRRGRYHPSCPRSTAYAPDSNCTTPPPRGSRRSMPRRSASRLRPEWRPSSRSRRARAPPSGWGSRSPPSRPPPTLASRAAWARRHKPRARSES
jgi:hypothetical protein